MVFGQCPLMATFCTQPFSVARTPNPLPPGTPLPMKVYQGKGGLPNPVIHPGGIPVVIDQPAKRFPEAIVGGGGPQGTIHYPINNNYPVQRADQRQPYVNYLPVFRVNKITSLRGPLTEVYSPQAGRPDSAVYECEYQSEGRLSEAKGMGVPWIRRDQACLNPLNWTEKKGRNSENFF